MNAGATFLLTAVDIHLWIILSNPEADPDHVLIVNLTSWTPAKDQSCILSPGDHPWIRHRSCINYGDSQVTTLERLTAACVGGALVLKANLSPRRAQEDSGRLPELDEDAA